MLLTKRILDKLFRSELEIREIAKRFINENNELRSGLNTFPDAVFIVDSNHFIRFANKSASKFLKKKERYYGRSLLKNLSLPEMAQCLEELLKNKEQSSQYRDLNLFFRIPRDFLIGVFQIETPSSPKPLTPSKQSHLILINDVSELKLRYLEESERNSVNSLTMLTSGIAHEIKNPLSALDLHLQLISRTLHKTDCPQKTELEELFSIVNHEVKRLDSIIDDFLQSYRPRKAIRKLLNLNDIVTLTISLLKAKIEDKNIHLNVVLDDKLKLFPFDKDLMEQLLLNILENSIEAIEEKVEPKIDPKVEPKTDPTIDPKTDPEIASSVEPTKRQLSVETVNRPGSLQLIIQDNGVGIKEEHLSKIFNPFYTSKKTGTGLGLSIVSRILNEHHGKVHVESREGLGTKISLEFYRHPHKTLLLETQNS